jgi:hypothetical protein
MATKAKPQINAQVQHQAADVLGGLEANLRVNLDTLIEQAAEQPILLKQAADYRVECLRRKNHAEQSRDYLEAATNLKMRQDGIDNGLKISEENLKKKVIVDPEVRAANAAYSYAEEEEERARLLVEAFRHRRDMIQVIRDVAFTEVGSQKAREALVGESTAARAKALSKYPGARQET